MCPVSSIIRELLWDDWNEDHIARHAIILDEVEDVCFGRHLRQRARSSDRLALYGQTDAGRYLLIILAGRGEGLYYPITARDMTSTERRFRDRLR